LIFDTLLWTWGAGNESSTLSQLKARAISLIKTPNEKELCRPLTIFDGIFIGSPKTIQISKFIFDTLLRVDVQTPTQALKSVNVPGNTIDLSPK
jgi:hypothetical protein